MKSIVLREMPDNEINDLLFEEKERLSKIKFTHSVSPLENPHQIKFSRRKIARIMTEIRRREIEQEKNK
ncbi:uncharacterized protein METZ01_LOCUS389374 [marine metagenome]|uniref:Ribosomal protein L29 n=1 Tax=marine metagenome TaxID=408172 RepID=A0A382UQN8_9ZZZZ|tara:strand:- start:334 stop:540 length:207 start_codon:yes stop_codon:yes gene_type:complete